MWYDSFVYRRLTPDSGTGAVLLGGGVLLRDVTVFLVVFVYIHEFISVDVHVCASVLVYPSG